MYSTTLIKAKKLAAATADNKYVVNNNSTVGAVHAPQPTEVYMVYIYVCVHFVYSSF